jgi:hypothetical protein
MFLSHYVSKDGSSLVLRCLLWWVRSMELASIGGRDELYNRYGPEKYPLIRKMENAKIRLAKTHNHVTFLIRSG